MNLPGEVVILNDYASLTGGSTTVASAAALGLAARDIDVTFFSAVGPVMPQLQDVPHLRVICLGQKEIGKNSNKLQAFVNGWRNGRAMQALRKLLAGKSRENTIVHAHTWTMALSPFVLQVAVEMGFRLVVTLHDFFITCPNGGFFVHAQSEICRRVPLSFSCWRCNCDRRNFGHKLWRNARTLTQNRILRLPEKVAGYIGVSAHSLNVMRPYLPAGIPARVVRNPVDCPREEPVAVAKNRNFLFIGRFSPEKGVKLFAQAARAAGVPAVFVGDGALMSEVRPICPSARFTGWLNQEQLRHELRSARALVFPPLWYETLGMVVVEAAAAGVPAIISDRCAATDFVFNNINGLYFAHGSAESLQRQMAAVAEDDGLAARLGQAAYDLYWRDPWTAEHHVSELLEIYNLMLQPTAYAAPGGKFDESVSCIRADG